MGGLCVFKSWELCCRHFWDGNVYEWELDGVCDGNFGARLLAAIAV